MSKYASRGSGVTVSDLIHAKVSGKKISMVTCYDAAFARLINETGIDVVLVGDSLGNVILGYEHTLPVTLKDMVHHAASVDRVLDRPFLCVDMPFFSYNISVEKAMRNAGRLVQEGGAQAVKIEGGQKICPQIEALVAAGIPVMGHLGFTPQSIHSLGGFKIQGKKDLEQRTMLSDARALEAAGAFCIVLELIPAELAREITAAVRIPTIGIGAGPHCDGQVLVLHDLLGFDQDFRPKFLKRFANVGVDIKEALKNYDEEVKSGTFPTSEHSF